ncbi:MAG: UDP-N-acetylmuramyl-tripeptide synthetase [Clostridiaceae bacterium]|nr:UDP-N-acetylmuramyl-tripeptide synthetase [Clostridiaceae bacterium]
MIIDNIEIKGVTCDSRKVKKGYAFVALKGEESDGNNFIDKAIENGASIIFTENRIPKEVMVKQVEDARKTLAELCNAFYDFPSEKLKIIGVTGTNGKTTTTHLIYQMLRDYGISTGLIGTLNIKINEKEYESQLTTPDAEVTYSYLHKMHQEGVEVVVMEVSSHGLKSHRVHGIEFDIAIHTNVEKDHLNFHKTVEDYIASKKKLFANLASGKFAIMNLDDENALKLLDNNKPIVVITYGLRARSTITASSIDTDFNTSFTYCLQRGITTLSGVEIEAFEYPINLNLLGKHNIYNTLAAVTCGLLLDVPIQRLAKSLRNFIAVPRRMEIIHKGEYTIIDDFCHNPASYETVFESIQSMQYRNLHIVNAIRGNRGIEVNYEIAEALRQWHPILKPKSLILTSSSEFVGEQDKVKRRERDIFIEVLSRDNISFMYEEELTKSLEAVIDRLEKDDILLLLGAQGMDPAAEIFLKMMESLSRLPYIEATHYNNREISRH